MMFAGYSVQVFPWVCCDDFARDPVCLFVWFEVFIDDGLVGSFEVLRDTPEPAHVFESWRYVFLVLLVEVLREVSTLSHVPGDEVPFMDSDDVVIVLPFHFDDSCPGLRKPESFFFVRREGEEDMVMRGAIVPFFDSLEFKNPEVYEGGEFPADSLEEVVKMPFCARSVCWCNMGGVREQELRDQFRETVPCFEFETGFALP